MIELRSCLMGFLLLIPAVILGAGGFIQLQSGLAVDAAFPVPFFMTADTPMPKSAYADAAGLLGHANIYDGDVQISLAEAEFQAGVNTGQILSQIERGLAEAPASAEGWAFYAQALAPSDPGRAGQALDQAFTLAPYEFFWAKKRAQLAVQIWNSLAGNTKNEALRQTRMLWEEPELREELLLLLATPDGAKILTRAYANDPDTLRAINRFVSVERRQLQPQKF